MIYVLDTHPVVWFLEGSSRLGASAQAAMQDGTAEMVVPTIILLEIQFLYSKKRIAVDLATVQRDLLTATNCVVYPLDEQVISLAPTSLNIHDAIIVGTALVYRDILKQPVALITKDTEIVNSGLVSTVW